MKPLVARHDTDSWEPEKKDGRDGQLPFAFWPGHSPGLIRNYFFVLSIIYYPLPPASMQSLKGQGWVSVLFTAVAQGPRTVSGP